MCRRRQRCPADEASCAASGCQSGVMTLLLTLSMYSSDSITAQYTKIECQIMSGAQALRLRRPDALGTITAGGAGAPTSSSSCSIFSSPRWAARSAPPAGATWTGTFHCTGATWAASFPALSRVCGRANGSSTRSSSSSCCSCESLPGPCLAASASAAGGSPPASAPAAWPPPCRCWGGLKRDPPALVERSLGAAGDPASPAAYPPAFDPGEGPIATAIEGEAAAEGGAPTAPEALARRDTVLTAALPERWRGWEGRGRAPLL